LTASAGEAEAIARPRGGVLRDVVEAGRPLYLVGLVRRFVGRHSGAAAGRWISHVIALAGELDLATTPVVKRELERVAGTEPPLIVLELRDRWPFSCDAGDVVSEETARVEEWSQPGSNRRPPACK
jgi:hypothetical protein